MTLKGCELTFNFYLCPASRKALSFFCTKQSPAASQPNASVLGIDYPSIGSKYNFSMQISINGALQDSIDSISERRFKNDNYQSIPCQ
jgi:hypothetical protein